MGYSHLSIGEREVILKMQACRSLKTLTAKNFFAEGLFQQ